eukprot:GILI01021142.1.p1 GENE.GILI01021142.1~~GILI01021142.1.p1  ORF type:complete len:184 (+),score=6.17 GILI01021142.1:38-553(+)
MSNDEVGQECIICLEPAIVPIHLSCECKFRCCKQCLLQWVVPNNNTECPWCRREDVRMLTEDNSDLSKRFYIEGRERLRAFNAIITLKKEGEEIDSTLLKKPLYDATDKFVNSIRADRTNPDPYNGCAYLFLLIGDTENAIRYADHVLTHIDPNHPMASEIRENAERIVGE